MLIVSDLARAPIVVDEFLPARRSLRLAFVCDVDPAGAGADLPAAAAVCQELRARGHELHLIHPPLDADPATPSSEGLIRNFVAPRLGHFKRAITAKRWLIQLWRLRRPDLVHITTEGALGWSALNAAAHLKLPVCSDFRASLQAYHSHIGVGWLRKPVLAHLRKFHNKSHCTLVPSEELKRTLTACGFRSLTVVDRELNRQNAARIETVFLATVEAASLTLTRAGTQLEFSES